VGDVLLRWNNVTDAISYQLQIREQGNIDWDDFSASLFFVILTGFLPNTTYEWRVHSVCTADLQFVSAYSPIENFTTGGISGGRISASVQNLQVEPYLEGIGENKPYTLYPNPASNQVSLSTTGYESIKMVTIFDAKGYLIQSVDAGQSESLTINLERMSPGIYFVRTITDQQVNTDKLIIR